MVVDYSQIIDKFALLNAYPIPNIHEQVSEIAKGFVFSILDLKSAYYQLPSYFCGSNSSSDADRNAFKPSPSLIIQDQ